MYVAIEFIYPYIIPGKTFTSVQNNNLITKYVLFSECQKIRCERVWQTRNVSDIGAWMLLKKCSHDFKKKQQFMIAISRRTFFTNRADF